jgi:hypothetical protein
MLRWLNWSSTSRKWRTLRATLSKRGYDHEVEAMLLSIREHLIEPRSLRFAPRNYVAVLLHNCVPALFGHLAQVVELRFKMLVASAHASVNSSSFLHFSSFFFD